MVDIRIPIGLMFSILGILISVFGLFTVSDPDLYQKSLGININLVMGIPMLVFGLLLFGFAMKKRKKEK